MYNVRVPHEGHYTDGVLAQLVERFNGIEEVSGSNPLCSRLRKQRVRSSGALFFTPGQAD